MRQRKRNSRGYTLVEMMVGVGIIVVMVAIGLPAMGALQRSQDFRSAARQISSELMRARSVAASGKKSAAWADNDRVISAGIQFDGSNGYVVFVDRDTQRDGDEMVTRTITLPIGMEIVEPAPGEEIRFRRDGTVVAPVNVVIYDSHRELTRTLVISGGGAVRIN